MTSNYSSITAILPLKINPYYEATSDLDRVLYLLLPSFEKFWTDKELLTVMIFVPKSNLNYITNRIKKEKFSLSIKIICEDEVCPFLKMKEGWWKQQVIKIASAKLINTDLFFTLDSDVILKKPLSVKDLFYSNKPIFQAESASLHWDYWLNSKSILKSEITFKPESIMMGVTPEILYRKICLELLEEIELRNETTDAAKFLLEKTNKCIWTEYTLYWLFLMEKNLPECLYSSKDIFYEWYPEDIGFNKKCIKEIFLKGDGFFMVIQSTLHISPQCLSQIMFPSSNKLVSSFKYYFYWLHWKGKLLKITFRSYVKKNLIKISDSFRISLIPSNKIKVN